MYFPLWQSQRPKHLIKFLADIEDDEYFSHMIQDDISAIVRDIRAVHKSDSGSAPPTTIAEELKFQTLFFDTFLQHSWLFVLRVTLVYILCLLEYKAPLSSNQYLSQIPDNLYIKKWQRTN